MLVWTPNGQGQSSKAVSGTLPASRPTALEETLTQEDLAPDFHFT